MKQFFTDLTTVKWNPVVKIINNVNPCQKMEPPTSGSPLGHQTQWRISPVQFWTPRPRTKFLHFSCIFTGRNEVVAKVMFLQVSVIHSVHRGGLQRTPPDQGEPPWTRENPPGTRQTSPGQTPQDQGGTPPWPSRPPQDQADHPRPGRTPPGPGRPPSRPPWDQGGTPRDQADPHVTRQTPLDQADPPGPADTTTPPPGRRLQHTVYERPVRILLECILVGLHFFWQFLDPPRHPIKIPRISTFTIVRSACSGEHFSTAWCATF